MSALLTLGRLALLLIAGVLALGLTAVGVWVGLFAFFSVLEVLPDEIETAITYGCMAFVCVGIASRIFDWMKGGQP